MLEKILESPLDWKEIKPVNPKGYQYWIFIGKTNAEAEAPIIWPPDVKSRLTGKDPDAGKDWRQEEKGDDRGWDGWMASPTQWTWVWASSRTWWQTGKLGMLQSMGSQRVRQDWAAEQQQQRTVFTFSILFLVTSAVIIWSWCFIDSLPLIGLSCKQTSNSGIWNHFFCYWLLRSYLWSYI